MQTGGASAGGAPIDLFLYEMLNGVLACMMLMLVIFIGRYQFLEWINHRWTRKRSKLSVSFGVVAAGELVTRGWTFWARHLEALGWPVQWMAQDGWQYTPLVGAGLSCLGALCAVRVLVPDEWGGDNNRGWTVCFCVTAAWTLLIALWR